MLHGSIAGAVGVATAAAAHTDKRRTGPADIAPLGSEDTDLTNLQLVLIDTDVIDSL